MASKRPRNYQKETAYEESPAQVKRRESRNKARAKAVKRLGKSAMKGKETDHIGFHRTGTLANVPVKVVSRHANRIRQPKRGKSKGYTQ